MQQQIDQDHIQNPVKEQSKPEIIPEYTRLLVEPLLSSGLLKKREYEILSHVIKQVTMNTNLNNLFYLILDEDKAGLNRREQLVFALSIIHIKKSKATAWLRYQSIIQPHSQRYLNGQNQSQILQVQPERNSFDIDTIENIFPIKLIENALKMLQEVFGINVLLNEHWP